MSRQTHRIRRHVFELEAPRIELARRAQDDVSRTHALRIVPAVEEACDEVSAADRLHRLDRLVVDVGAIAAHEFPEALVEKLGDALRRALRAEIQAEERREAARGRSVGVASALELFAEFARTGNLPWWADSTRAGLLAENARALLREAPEALAELLRELAREPEALRRIAVAHDDALLTELCAPLFAARDARATAALPPALAALLQGGRLDLGLPAARCRGVAWQCVLRVAAGYRTDHAARAAPAAGAADEAALVVCKEILVEIAVAVGTTYGELLSVLDESKSLPAVRPLLGRPPLGELLDRLHQQHLQAGGARRAPPVAPGDTVARARPGAPPEPGASLRAARPEDDEPEVYTHHAGLVILWPFLLGLLRSLDLLEEGRFKDPPSRHRAAAILHHLASGALDPVEYQLPLEKVLCGLDVTRLVEPGDPISDAEAEACVQFLAAVIAEAPILKDMSVPIFQATFLRRLGSLGARDGAWLVRVERMTHDAVLDRFPWSFDWVALPWMEAPLRVEWHRVGP